MISAGQPSKDDPITEAEADYLSQIGNLDLSAQQVKSNDGWPTAYDLLQEARHCYRRGDSIAQAGRHIRGLLGLYS